MNIVEQLYRVTFLGDHSELLTPEEFKQLQQECREIAEYGLEDAEYESFGEMIGRLDEFLAGPYAEKDGYRRTK